MPSDQHLPDSPLASFCSLLKDTLKCYFDRRQVKKKKQRKMVNRNETSEEHDLAGASVSGRSTCRARGDRGARSAGVGKIANWIRIL